MRSWVRNADFIDIGSSVASEDWCGECGKGSRAGVGEGEKGWAASSSKVTHASDFPSNSDEI